VANVHCRTSVDEDVKHAADDEEEEEEVAVRELDRDDDLDVVMEFDQQLLQSVGLQSSESDKTRLCTRRIIAEDPSWTLSIVPSLADICVRHIADNFCC